MPLPQFNDVQILAARGPKFALDVNRPYAFFVEPEFTSDGLVEDVATIFLTNRECPFRCLMCDLWQHTTDQRVPLGAIPQQIDFALERLPAARHVKLYNSGNFFDRQAVPAADHRAIAERVKGFRRVIVENHPTLCGDGCREFRDLIGTELEIALGLETVHPEVLERLNKRMTVGDFERAANGLRSAGIHVRAFILLRPPFLSEEEGIEWAVRSIDLAFAAGAECCVVIPTRAGNGIMESLATAGLFHPPRLSSLEWVMEQGLSGTRGRLFADLWNAEKLAECHVCSSDRIERLRKINLTQSPQPRVQCDICGAK